MPPPPARPLFVVLVAANAALILPSRSSQTVWRSLWGDSPRSACGAGGTLAALTASPLCRGYQRFQVCAAIAPALVHGLAGRAAAHGGVCCQQAVAAAHGTGPPPYPPDSLPHTMPIVLDSLDHVVLTVASIDKNHCVL